MDNDRRGVLILSPAGACTLAETEGKDLELSYLQGLVGGYIETVVTVLSDNWSKEDDVGLRLLVDEEGAMKGLPYNETATMMMSYLYDLGMTLRGPAVLVGTKGDALIALRWNALERIRQQWCAELVRREQT